MKPIQILLLVGFALVLFLTRKQLSPSTKFTGRIGFILLSFLLFISIIFPDITSKIAMFLGVGRGADLVVYFTCLGLLGLAALVLSKFRKLDREITRLVRALSLEEFTNETHTKE